MATLSNSQGGLDYIGIFDSKLVQRVPEGTEGAVARQLTAGPNEGKMIWERQYTTVCGMITGGGVAVKEFGAKKVKEIQIKLDDNIMLQLPMHLLSSIAQPLPNVDASQPVMISVYRNKRGKTGLAMSQNGNNCEWHYTRENPNGLPKATQDELGEWDFRDHDKFLVRKVNEFFDFIDATTQQAKPPTINEPEIPGYDEPPATDEDIPW